jgi:hypothetical protein
MEAELFHADGQRVVTKLMAALCNFTRTRLVLRRLVLCYICSEILGRDLQVLILQNNK